MSGFPDSSKEGFGCAVCLFSVVPTVFFILLLTGSADYAHLGKEGVWKQTECFAYYEFGGGECCLDYSHHDEKCVKHGQETIKFMNISLEACPNTTEVAQFEDWDCKDKSTVGNWPGIDASPIDCWTNCKQWMGETPWTRYGKAKAKTVAAFVLISIFCVCTCVFPPLAFGVLCFIWFSTVFNCGCHVAGPDECNLLNDAYNGVGALLSTMFIFLSCLGCCCGENGITYGGGCISMALFCCTFLHWLITAIGISQLDGIHPKECFDVDWCGDHAYVTMGGPGAWASLALVAGICFYFQYWAEECSFWWQDLCECCGTVFKDMFCGLKELFCCFIGLICLPCAQTKNVCEEILEKRQERNEILNMEKQDYAARVAIFNDVDKRWQCAKDTVMPLIGYRDHIWNEIWTMMWDMEVQAYLDESDLSDFYAAIKQWPVSPITKQRYDWETSVQIKTCCNCFKGEILQITTLAESKGNINWTSSKNTEIEISEITTVLPALPGAEV